MDEKELLSKIGLSENEVSVYLALLRLGKLSAYEIAQRTGIYRPHVYDKLETLIKKSLVSYVQRGKKKIFSAAPPSKILDYLKEQEDEIKKDIKLLSENLTNLNSLYNVEKEDTKVQVFTGIEGLKLRINDTLESSRGEILVFGLDDAKYNELLPTFLMQHFKLLKAKGIKERIIAQKRKGAFMFNNEVDTYRFLESGQINPTNTVIYGNKVSFVIWGTPITSIPLQKNNREQTN